MIDSKGHWTEFEEGKKNLYYHLIDFHFQPLRLIIFEEGVVQYKGKYGNLKSSLFHISKTQYQNQYHGNILEAWYTDTVIWCHFFFHQQQNQQG